MDALKESSAERETANGEPTSRRGDVRPRESIHQRGGRPSPLPPRRDLLLIQILNAHGWMEIDG